MDQKKKKKSAGKIAMLNEAKSKTRFGKAAPKLAKTSRKTVAPMGKPASIKLKRVSVGPTRSGKVPPIPKPKKKQRLG